MQHLQRFLLTFTPLFLCFVASPLWAQSTTRYALLFGNNSGASDEAELRYAVRDAERVAAALNDVAGFKPENTIVLKEPTALRVREALASLNARIRREQSAPHQEGEGANQSVLFVFYSGHAGSDALHLGPTKISWSEIRNLTSASPATARVLVADACRSGQVTRVKGFSPSAPFLGEGDTELPEGFALLSSAAAGESAQESDAIAGSFFTHHFVAGLRGVADLNGDGQVTLSELYSYTQAQTLSSTANSAAGAQHATYAFELKGRKALVLTRAKELTGLARVTLSRPGRYWFREKSEEGEVVLEARVGSEARKVWLPPGDYFVQRRGNARLEQAEVKLTQRSRVQEHRLDYQKIEYAQYVRKGGVSSGPGYSLSLNAQVGQSPLVRFTPPMGGLLRFGVVLKSLSLDASLGFAQSAYKSPEVSTRVRRTDASIAIRRALDVSSLSFSFGVRSGAQLFIQTHSSTRETKTRRSITPFVEPLLRADWNGPGGVFLSLDVALRAQLLNVQEGLSIAEHRRIQSLTPWTSAGIGKHF